MAKRLTIDDLKVGMYVTCFHDDGSSHPQRVSAYDLTDERGRAQMGVSFMELPEPGEAAVEELTEAIRLTVEYVGTETLPAIEGWSWYDALVKYAPEKAKALVPKPFPTETGSVIRAQYRDYDPQVCLLTNNGWTDEDSDIYEIGNKDLKLIEVLYDAGSVAEEAPHSCDATLPCDECGYDPAKYNNGFTYDRT